MESESVQKSKQHQCDSNFSACVEITEPGKTSWQSGFDANKTDVTGNSVISGGDGAPEKKLTLFALQLAVLEKTASGLGTLGFVWATVVLLGGFAITLEKIDFWFITTILLIEGTRIFSRSHELEWQHHQASWSLSDAGKFSFRALQAGSHFLLRALRSIFRHGKKPEISHEQRRRGIVGEFPLTQPASQGRWTWPESDVPLLPYAGWVFLSKNISKFLYWLQLCSAFACISLSLMRISRQEYGEIAKSDSDKRNRKSALNIFYSLALAEALLFLMERGYWEWKISCRKLLRQVNRECGFENSGIIWIKRFFYDSYSRCVNGSIFDGIRMNLVSFAGELLLPDSSVDEQLAGARILRKFVTDDRFSDETLRKIGTSGPILERLLEILNWKNTREEEIRKCVAEIVSKLAGKKQNSLRVASIPGSLESISSLLYTGRSSGFSGDEINQKSIVADQENYEFSAFNLLGLSILKKLANDHDNCGKIGNTRGLLAKIIDFTHAGEWLLRNNRAPESQITAVKRSLQLVKMLASSTGVTGKILRQEISEIVFTISNIREILQYGESHVDLQKLGIEILTSLALDEDAKEMIGSTGGIFKQLLSIFFKQVWLETQNQAAAAAGEAIAMLALDSERNCDRILRLGVMEDLVGALKSPILCVNSARILRNLCAYGGSNCFLRLKGVTAAAPTVLRAIMAYENKSQEIAIGLAAQIFRFTSCSELNTQFERAGISKKEFAAKLVQILRFYEYPSIRLPRIRRFVMELAIVMMKSSSNADDEEEESENVEIFRKLDLKSEVERIEETTSEIECFNVFSGSVGLSRHTLPVHALVSEVLQLLSS